jgi:hypothetical protein
MNPHLYKNDSVLSIPGISTDDRVSECYKNSSRIRRLEWIRSPTMIYKLYNPGHVSQPQ